MGVYQPDGCYGAALQIQGRAKTGLVSWYLVINVFQSL
jgi:hypothetical protein